MMPRRASSVDRTRVLPILGEGKTNKGSTAGFYSAMQ
jgi:hypothetical protein